MTQVLPAPTPVGPPRPAPAAGPPGRIELIDVLRGVACLWVILHHSHIYWRWRVRAPVLWRVEDVADAGFLGVHLFLAVSGFVLFYPVVRRHGLAGARVAAGPFLARRGRRILPPYYAALAICLALCLWPQADDLLGNPRGRSVLLHLTMLFNLDPSSIGSINGAFWSLALESQLYLTFPLLVWGCRQGRWGLGGVLVATLAVALLWQGVVSPRMMPRGVSNVILWRHQAAWFYALPGRCFEFAMGMAAAAAVARHWRWRTTVAAVAVCLAGPAAFALAVRHGQCGPYQDQLAGVAFAGLIVLTAGTPAWVGRLAVVRGLGWVGGISYSVYLVHTPVLKLATLGLNRVAATNGQRIGLFAVVAVPLIVGLGFAFHLAFERPFMSAPRPPVTPPLPVEGTDPVREAVG